MNLVDFTDIFSKKKQANPFWFDDEPDQLAQDNQIVDIESQLGVKLPNKYKDFVKHFGGGYLGFTNIFSADRDGMWYIIEKNKNARRYLPKNFIAISDDETGGLYGYKVSEGVCSEEVFYWDHEDNSISEKMYDDLFEFIVCVGLTN